MSRDHKPVKQRAATTTRSRGGTLLGVFIGLVVGVGAALAVVWYMNKTPAPFVPNKTQTPADPGKPALAGPAVAPAPAGTPAAAGAAPTPAPLPGKPGDPPVEKRFQFYDILPGKSEPKPDAKSDSKTDGAAPSPAGAPAKAPPADVQLQAGSFQNSKDADNLKATLALSGLEASVQQVMVGDKVWYRVRLGPYHKPEDATKAKTDLSKLGIEADIVKGKD